MEFNSITIPEGKVIKIFANNILIWKISSSTTILPLTNSPGEMPITVIDVKKGQIVTITYYLTKQQGYIYDGRNCGLQYYGSVSSTKYPMKTEEVRKECTLTLTIPQGGNYPEDMAMRINVFYGAGLIFIEEYNELMAML